MTLPKTNRSFSHCDVPLIARKGHVACHVVNKPQLHHKLVSPIDKSVSFPDVLSPNLELGLLVFSGGVFGVNVDFIFRYSLTRGDYSKKRRSTVNRAADIALVSGGIRYSSSTPVPVASSMRRLRARRPDLLSTVKNDSPDCPSELLLKVNSPLPLTLARRFTASGWRYPVGLIDLFSLYDSETRLRYIGRQECFCN
jgi:hypothetical protein